MALPPAAFASEAAEINLERAALIAESLRGDFLSLLRSFPAQARNVSEIARFLDVARPICHRLVTSVRRASDPLDLLVALPGVRGLEQIVAAARTQGCDAAAVANAEQAVARYAELVEKHGGSQSKLNASIQAARVRRPISSSMVNPTQQDYRRAMYESARVLCDRWCECKLAVTVLGPSAGDNTLVDHVAASGYTGLRAGPNATPLCSTQRLVIGWQPTAVHDSPIHDLHGDAPMHGHTPQALLEEFCSRPLARVTSRTRGAEIDQLIDLERADSGEGMDVFVASRSSRGTDPRNDDPPIMNYAVIADAPPRRMIIAIHLHRSLARDCVASAGCYVLGTRGTMSTRVGVGGALECGRPSERWFDRMTHRATVEYLGPGFEGIDVDAYPRMRELYAHLLAANSWDAEDFLGFRCVVEYPIWSTEYLLSLDFAKHAV